MEKPNAQELYIQRYLYENLCDAFYSTDEVFNEFSTKYIVVFE